MSKPKNKTMLFMVMRCNPTQTPVSYDVCCCITKTYERAVELCGQYGQEMADKGIHIFDFYVQGQIYYDE